MRGRDGRIQKEKNTVRQDYQIIANLPNAGHMSLSRSPFIIKIEAL